MTTNITIGMHIPELDLSNFTIAETGKIDINKYFSQLGDITSTVKDDNIKKDLFNRYILFRLENIPEFAEAHNEWFNVVFDNTFKCEVGKTLRVGEFYTTQEAKKKIKELYNHEFAPFEFFNRTAKLTDLTKNGWFKYKYSTRIINGERVRGVWIIDCLF